MSTLPTEVKPGDLISANLMNAILEQFRNAGGQGPETVPDVFGTFLASARLAILPPAHELSLGFIFDAFGASVQAANNSCGDLLWYKGAIKGCTIVTEPSNARTSLHVSR